MLENVDKLKLATKPMAQFDYYLSDESDQDDITTATHISIFLQFFSKGS